MAFSTSGCTMRQGTSAYFTSGLTQRFLKVGAAVSVSPFVCGVFHSSFS
jgi:hypothetical protein